MTNLFQLPDKHLTLDISSGVKWKELRKALSPTFSSGQLKSMLAPMSDVANVLMEFLDKELSKSKGVVNLRKCFEGLALDTISRCAFGIDTDANNNTDQDILRWGKESFASVRVDGWIVAGFFRLFFLFPSLARYLPLIPPAIDRLREMTGHLMKQHKVQETKNTNFVARLSDILDNPNSPAILTEDLVTAQGVIFFIAGFETTANSLSTLCYNLSQNPEVQETLYQEIQEVLREHGGKITHDTINHMKYLEACIMENLRIMGPVTIHSRVCSKDCEVKPGFLIKKGTRVDLNIHASHHWSDYFHNPEKFQPERFLKENEQEIIPYTYRPFGGKYNTMLNFYVQCPYLQINRILLSDCFY